MPGSNSQSAEIRTQASDFLRFRMKVINGPCDPVLGLQCKLLNLVQVSLKV